MDTASPAHMAEHLGTPPLTGENIGQPADGGPLIQGDPEIAAAIRESFRSAGSAALLTEALRQHPDAYHQLGELAVNLAANKTAVEAAAKAAELESLRTNTTVIFTRLGMDNEVVHPVVERIVGSCKPAEGAEARDAEDADTRRALIGLLHQVPPVHLPQVVTEVFSARVSGHRTMRHGDSDPVTHVAARIRGSRSTLAKSADEETALAALARRHQDAYPIHNIAASISGELAEVTMRGHGRQTTRQVGLTDLAQRTTRPTDDGSSAAQEYRKEIMRGGGQKDKENVRAETGGESLLSEIVEDLNNIRAIFASLNGNSETYHLAVKKVADLRAGDLARGIAAGALGEAASVEIAALRNEYRGARTLLDPAASLTVPQIREYVWELAQQPKASDAGILFAQLQEWFAPGRKLSKEYTDKVSAELVHLIGGNAMMPGGTPGGDIVQARRRFGGITRLIAVELLDNPDLEFNSQEQAA
ncbi:MAG TPA: hypothetical protein VMY99_05600 [Nevskiaceae bacterium]|nr:hypothetical protein [Nevskiaceae bacterium]